MKPDTVMWIAFIALLAGNLVTGHRLNRLEKQWKDWPKGVEVVVTNRTVFVPYFREETVSVNPSAVFDGNQFSYPSDSPQEDTNIVIRRNNP